MSRPAAARPEVAVSASPPAPAMRWRLEVAGRPGRRWAPADRSRRRQAAGALALLASALLPLPWLVPQGQPPAANAPRAERVTLLRLLPHTPPTDLSPLPATPVAPATVAGAAAQPPAADRRVSPARPVPRPAVGQAITLPMVPPVVRPGAGPTLDAPSAAPDIDDDPVSGAQQASPAPASAPTAPQAPVLRLDDTVMRIAAREALNPLRGGDGPRLIEPEALSAADRLGREVAETAKPACLRPGASLLSLPLVLLEAVTDRCR